MTKVSINFNEFFRETEKEKYLAGKAPQNKINTEIINFLESKNANTIEVLINANQKVSLNDLYNQLREHFEDEIWKEHLKRVNKNQNQKSVNPNKKQNQK